MLTIEGKPVISMTLTRPVSGLWVASIEVDTDENIDGAVTLAQGELSFAGYVVRSGVVAGICAMDVVGGEAGGLVRDVTARSYQGITARTVASEALSDVGESLDVTSTRATMATSLAYWTRVSGRASAALWKLADSLGARWRVQPSGAVWMGVDAWPVLTGIEVDELDRDARASSVLIAPDTIELSPGVTFNGDRVGRIEYDLGRDADLRATYWTEAP